MTLRQGMIEWLNDARDWYNFDIEHAETVLAITARRLGIMPPSNHRYAQLQDTYTALETAVDMFHRFAELDLILLDEDSA
jgi:hypothetical protein